MADRAGVIQHLNVNVNTAASNVLVAGETGKCLCLVGFVLVAAGAVVATFEDTSGTDRMGPMSLAANGGVIAPDSGPGWTRTASGQGLNLLLGGAVQVGGCITYRMVPDHTEY